MRTIILLLLAVVLFSGAAYAQVADQRANVKDIVYIPGSFFAGKSLAVSDSAARADTTRAVSMSGFYQVNLTVHSSHVTSRDSISFLVYYQGSKDGVTWDPTKNLIDSLNTGGNNYASKSFAIPSSGLGYEFVRFIVNGSNSAMHSVNPKSTLTYYIRKKQ